MEITPYLKAGYPALFISTIEPHRAIETIHPDGWKTHKWDCLRGIVDCQTEQIIDDVKDPLGALQWLSNQSETLLFVSNFHYFIESVEVIQAIQNNIPNWKGNGCCLAMVGPPVQLPTEISTYFTILDFYLPSYADLLKIQTELAENVGIPACHESVDAALGLTEFEAETAFAFSLVQEKRFFPRCYCSAEAPDDQKNRLDGILAPGADRIRRRIKPAKNLYQKQDGRFSPG